MEEKTNASMNLYDLNKNIMQNIPKEAIPTEEQIKEEISKFVATIDTNYFMLLGNEIKYYTIFEKTDSKDLLEGSAGLVQEVIWCLQDLGEILSCSQEPGALEFWVRDAADEPQVLYFFDYSAGIIYFSED